MDEKFAIMQDIHDREFKTDFKMPKHEKPLEKLEIPFQVPASSSPGSIKSEKKYTQRELKSIKSESKSIVKTKVEIADDEPFEVNAIVNPPNFERFMI